MIIQYPRRAAQLVHKFYNLRRCSQNSRMLPQKKINIYRESRYRDTWSSFNKNLKIKFVKSIVIDKQNFAKIEKQSYYNAYYSMNYSPIPWNVAIRLPITHWLTSSKFSPPIASDARTVERSFAIWRLRIRSIQEWNLQRSR